eukprot:797220-Rhodomonas_salina.3
MRGTGMASAAVCLGAGIACAAMCARASCAMLCTDKACGDSNKVGRSGLAALTAGEVRYLPARALRHARY